MKKASFDHTLILPCQAVCPLHMEIREYIDLIAQGRIMEALQVIRDGNPFPSICAHVCTHHAKLPAGVVRWISLSPSGHLRGSQWNLAAIE